MKKMTEETFNSLWIDFLKYYELAGLKEYQDPETLLTGMKIGAAGISEDSGVAYPGALLNHIVMVCALAERIAKNVRGTFPIEGTSLFKVCILQQLSKLEMFVPNDNEWEVEKRGFNYKFNDTPGVLKVGERSILNAMNAGIPLTAVEFEAMRCMDKDFDESRTSKGHTDILTIIVRSANELAYAIEKEHWNRENKK